MPCESWPYVESSLDEVIVTVLPLPPPLPLPPIAVEAFTPIDEPTATFVFNTEPPSPPPPPSETP